MAISKAVKTDKRTLLIQGIRIHFSKVKTITLKGKTVQIASIVDALQASIDARADTFSKRAVYLDAAKTSREADAASDPQALALTELLQSTMSATDLADFGIQRKTRAVPDVATKALAIRKSAATREARGTMGRRQRQKIVGVVNGAGGAGRTGNGTTGTGGATS